MRFSGARFCRPDHPAPGFPPAPQPTNKTISASELAKHDGANSCWILYGGSVYDITEFLNQHPGGPQAILPYCGKSDGSFASAFEAKHGTSKADMLTQVGILEGSFAG